MPEPLPTSRALRAGLWSAALAWAVAIFVASSIPRDAGLPLPPSGWDKVAHAVVFAGLGGLITLALRADGHAARLAGAIGCGVALVYGGLDEVHQQFVPGRTPAYDDVAADGVGAALGALLVVTAPGLVITPARAEAA